MSDRLENKQVLVLGLGSSGVAAAHLLRKLGATVVGLDQGEGAKLEEEKAKLAEIGVTTHLGVNTVPAGTFDFAVVSPGISKSNPLMRATRRRQISVIGEMELGFEHAACLNISISGTNGKTTTTELISQMLLDCHRKTIAAGNIGLPICSVVDQSRELDFLTLEVSSFQLETIQYFRPSVAVLLNITPDHLDRYASMKDYTRAKARLFLNQQQFDWAIVQANALAQLRALKIEIPSKVITFSATDPAADLYFDRGLIVSRIPDWSGPLLDMDDCRLRGPHNAENLMAALVVGKVLRLPLESVVESLKAYRPAPHRCEVVAEINGVTFVNDSKATNVDALHRALLTLSPGKVGEPNIWLIAGGKDKGFEYHDVGPVLSERVKGAFLLGEAREKIRAAWSLFTPCTLVDSLLEAVTETAKRAVPGDVVLLSPACSSFDQFQNYQHRGEVFRQAVLGRARATGGMSKVSGHNLCAVAR